MKIALAGSESKEALEVLKQLKPPNILVTHMYLSKKSKDKVESILKEYREMGCWIIVDSGAFTFLRKYGILRTDMSMEDFRENYRLHRDTFEEWQLDRNESQRRFDDEFQAYYDKWFSYLDLYYEYADMIAEIDLDTILGIQRMTELREQYSRYKDKICYTPHVGFNKEPRFQTSEEAKYIKDFFDTKPKFLGIGNINSKITEGIILEYLPLFKKEKIKVHGWAQTDWETIQRLPYFSIDSSTWLSASKFGVTFEYKDGWTKMKSHDYRQKEVYRKQCQRECEENSIDYEGFVRDEPKPVLKWSAVQWIRLANNYEQDLSRAYWLDDQEVASVIDEKREKNGINELVVRETQKVSILNDLRSDIGRMCNVCEISTQCTYFKINHTCAFSNVGLGGNLTSKQLMQHIIDLQLGRVSQAVLSERVKGGTVDANVTKEMQVLAKMVKDLDVMNTDGTGIHITAKGEKSVGVLERLFGNPNSEDHDKNVVHTEPIEDAEIVNE